MSEAIIVALITGGLSLLGVVIANNKNARDMDAKLDKQQAINAERIEELTREVRKHNGFAEKIPVIQEQIKVVNHRLEDLEAYHK